MSLNSVYQWDDLTAILVLELALRKAGDRFGNLHTAITNLARKPFVPEHADLPADLQAILDLDNAVEAASRVTEYYCQQVFAPQVTESANRLSLAH